MCSLSLQTKLCPGFGFFWDAPGATGGHGKCLSPKQLSRSFPTWAIARLKTYLVHMVRVKGLNAMAITSAPPADATDVSLAYL